MKQDGDCWKYLTMLVGGVSKLHNKNKFRLNGIINIFQSSADAISCIYTPFYDVFMKLMYSGYLL